MRDGMTRAAALLVGLSLSPAAWALPWNIDMVDSDAIKAYEQVMLPLPDGTMSQPNVLTPISYRRNYVRESAEGQALTPKSSGLDLNLKDEKVLANGERLYNIYCQPCHGDGQVLGPVAAPGRYPGVAILKGDTGRVATKTDGHLFLTIRNGGGLMPAYGWSMTESEMWSVVGYIRKAMANGNAPAGAAASTATPDGILPPATPTAPAGTAPAPTPTPAPAGAAPTK